MAMACLTLHLLGPGSLFAQEDSPAIEQLTENVGVGLIARNMDEFNREFTELCREAQIPIERDTLANLFYSPLRRFGIDVDETVNRQGSGGLVWIDSDLSDFTLRYIYPINESDPVAEALGVDTMEMKAGSAYRTDLGDIVMLDGKVSIGISWNRLNVGEEESPKPIENPFGEIGSISKHLSANDHRMFGNCDATMMLSKSASGMFWQQALQPMFGEKSGESEMWNRLSKAGDEIRFGLAAIDIDEGLHVRSKSFFTNTTDGAAMQLVRDIRGGDSPSDLKFLPDAQVLMAGAAKGSGEQNSEMAKSIVKLIVEIGSPGEEVLTSDDKKAFYDSFEAIWKKLNGTRMALYRNEGEIGDAGELALVTIFDVTDPAALLRSIPGLVYTANEGAKRAAPDGEEPEISFEYLPHESQIEGLDMMADVLTFKSSRIGDSELETLRRFFGTEANQLKFVTLENHVVMFIGTNPALLKSTIANLRKQNAGLAEHPAFVAANERLDPRRKIEFHFSARNFDYIYSAMIRERKDLGRYARPDEVTSFALMIEEERFGFDFWMPLKELDRAVKLLMASF